MSTNILAEKTSLVGKVKTEINCLPVENDHFRQIMQERSKREFKPIRETMLLSGPASSHAGTVLNPSTAGPSGNLENFIVSILSSSYTSIDCSRKPPLPHETKAKTTKPLEYHRMSSWILFMAALRSSNTGVSRTLERD